MDDRLRPSVESPTRVVSLAPSATATLVAVGAGDLLAGITTHCDPGPERDPPVVGGWLSPDFDRVDALNPDLICTSDDLQADVRDELRDRGHRVHHAAPRTLDDVVASFEALGRAVDRPEAGAKLAEGARERLARVREGVAERPRPTVYCEEWSDPPMAAGNWIPDAVTAAGGRYPFCEAGERSRAVTRAEVEDADPDRVILHLCGYGDRADPDSVAARGWDIDASVHVFDDSLLNQPSPRLLDGVERLADVFAETG